LQRLNVPRQAGETLAAYIERAATAFPAHRTQLMQTHTLFSQWFFAEHFGKKSQALAKIKAKNLARQLHWLYWRKKLTR